MSSAIERLAALRDKRMAVEKEMEQEGKVLFAEASADLFTAHPVLVKFGWRQYTPYFNDGDECTFSADTEYIDYVTKDEDGKEHEHEDFSAWRLRDKPAESLSPQQAAGVAALDLLAMFSDDDFKLLFGDHVSVTVTAQGVETEEYSHD